MKRLIAIALLVMIALTPAALAQTVAPQANSNGDYPRTSHPSWTVVYQDSPGLDCRWSEEMPDDWYSPGAQFSDMNVRFWPVVRRFEDGTILTANTAPAGFAIMYDDLDFPWIKVSLSPDDEICLVRANQQFVRPLE